MRATILLLFLCSGYSLFSQSIEMNADTIEMSVNGITKLRVAGNTLEMLNNQNSVYIGEQAGESFAGTTNRNVGIGYQSLLENIQGRDNLAVGYLSLSKIVDGDYNVALGYRAMGGNISEATYNDNIGIGSFSLFNQKKGDDNIAIGTNAMISSDSSSMNVALGHNSLRNLNFGESNVGIGNEALYSSKTGKWNVAVGNEAGFENTGGLSNTYVGYRSGKENTGTSNVMIGKDAGLNNASGASNTFVGKSAGQNSSGSSNIFIGNQVGSNNTGSDNIFIGDDTGINSDSDMLVIDNGDNPANPLISGDFGFKVLRFHKYLYINPPISGFTPINLWVNADPNDVLFNFMVDSNTKMHMNSTGKLSIGSSIAESDLHLHHENIASTGGLTIENKSGGNYWRMWTNDQTGSLRFYSKEGEGNSCGNSGGNDDYVAWITACSGAWNSTSDRRKKKNLILLKSVLPSIMDLQVYDYNFISEEDGSKKHIGLMAQDVEPHFPQLINYDEEADLYTMNYDGLGPIAIKAIQELKIENKNLAKEIEELKDTLEIVLDQLEKLKSN